MKFRLSIGRVLLLIGVFSIFAWYGLVLPSIANSERPSDFRVEIGGGFELSSLNTQMQGVFGPSRQLPKDATATTPAWVLGRFGRLAWNETIIVCELYGPNQATAATTQPSDFAQSWWIVFIQELRIAGPLGTDEMSDACKKYALSFANMKPFQDFRPGK